MQAFGGGVQRVLRELVLQSQRRKGALPFEFLRAWNGTGNLPGRVGAQVPEPSLPFGQDGVIELASCFQMGPQTFGLPRRHLERQFQEEGRRRFLRVHLLLCAGLPLPEHWMEVALPCISNSCSNDTPRFGCCQALAQTIRWPSPACHQKKRWFIPRINREGFPARLSVMKRRL